MSVGRAPDLCQRDGYAVTLLERLAAREGGGRAGIGVAASSWPPRPETREGPHVLEHE